MNLKQFFTLLMLFILISGGYQATSSGKYSQISKSIDEYIYHFIKSSEPGGVIIVTKDGEVIYREAFGMANMELSVIMKPEMVFNIGSLTKQFTAVSAMILVEKDQLSLSDYLEKYFPDFPGSDQIQIKHLLTHTSGIRDYIPIKEFHDQLREDLTNNDVLEIVKKESLEFNPGEKFSYSNSNYALIGAIIEKITGKSYEQFILENVLKPLGLSNTQMINNTKIIPGLVDGYEFINNEIRKARLMSWTYLHAAGGLCTNVDDLAKWNNSVFSGKLISYSSLNQCLTPQKLNNGESAGMGMGWFIGELYRREYLYHGGGIFGFVNHTLYLPEENLYVAVLRNYINRSTDTKKIAEATAGIVLGEYEPPQIKETVSLSAEQMNKLIGVYRFDDNSVRKIMLINGKLYYGIDENRKEEMFAESITKFYIRGGEVQFEFQYNDEGEVVSMRASMVGRSKKGIKL